MEQLSAQQRERFWNDGYLLVEQAVDDDLLRRLRADFAGWVEESREHDQPWGRTVDGRARFDLETGHRAERPGLRRVNAPVEVSQAYYDAMFSSCVAHCVAELIGPNVKLHHSKINSKLPGGNTEVKWHQDFPFTPHSNDDLVTALLMVDEVTLDNGPLEVVPGSHRGPLYSLWHEGVFTGAVAETVAQECRDKAVECTGSAGSVCLMHTRLLHGSAPNRSTRARTLFICVYAAEDAVAYSSNPVPSEYDGLIVRGEKSNRVRSIDYRLELPQKPASASFFDQQARRDGIA